LIAKVGASDLETGRVFASRILELALTASYLLKAFSRRTTTTDLLLMT